MHELTCYRDYVSDEPLSYWRSTSGFEVDFIIGDHTAIEVKAKGEAVLKPGGLHVMLIDLKAPMKEGDSVPITLTFDDGSSKQIDAKVVRPSPAPMPMDHKQ